MNGMLLSLNLHVLFLLAIATASASQIYVPDDYSRIQWAIDNSSVGGTIIVKSGTYYENVNVSKKLILTGMSAGGRKPVIDANGTGSAVTLSADGITFQDFKVIDSGDSGTDAGVKVLSSSNTIKGNDICENRYGIYFQSSNNNSITENTIKYNRIRGVQLSNSSNNSIYLNDFANNFNAYSDSNNHWNSTKPIIYHYHNFTFANFMGNYWHDYTGSDIDDNGIGNVPYRIPPANKDVAPLMRKFEEYYTVQTPEPLQTAAPVITFTTAPKVTPTTTRTPFITSTPPESPPEQKIAGFEALFAVAGISVAYLLRRK